MEEVQALCKRVGQRVNLYPMMAKVPGFAQGPNEQSLLPAPRGNQYSLGGTLRTRYLIDGYAMRNVWVDACVRSVDGDIFFRPQGPFPLLYLENEHKLGALTAQLKSCYTLPEAPEKARVALDLDGLDSTKPFPEFLQLVTACRAMLAEHTVNKIGVDWEQEPVIVFMLSTEQKNRSAHVIFPNLCFSKSMGNILGKAHPLTESFNKMLAPLGMQGDFSICNSGLRWEFGDKFPPNENIGRGVVAAPFFDKFDAELITYEDLALAIDPHVLPQDPAYKREIDWKLPADNRPLRRRAVAADGGNAAAPAENVISNATTAELRIYEAVPELAGVPFKRFQQPGGCIKLVPQSNFCPFKEEPSDNCPAHQHASPKLYIFCDAVGRCTVKCGVCADKCLNIRAPEIEKQSIMERFNSKYARLGNDDKVIVLPQVDLHGELCKMNIVSFATFKNMTADPGLKKVKVNPHSEKEVAQYLYWYHSPNARRYSRIDFDPSNSLPASVYNSYEGFDRRVLAQAEHFADFTEEQLLAEFRFTRRLILHNICSKDGSTFTAFLSFFKDLVLFPGRKPNWGICMFGPQGCGKGLTAQFFLKMVGRPHGIHGDAETIRSQWNADIVQALLLFADEGTPDKDTRALSTIKKLITEEELTARQKYAPNRQVKTAMRVLVASNENAVVIENRDRRWMCCNAKYTLGDENSDEFRALIANVVRERESLRGPAAFYVWAQKFGIDPNFSINKPINTPARWELKLENMTPFEKYLYNVCMSGAICSTEVDLTRLSKHQRIGFMETASLLGCPAKDIGGAGLFELPEAVQLHKGKEEERPVALPLSLWWVGFCQEHPRLPAGVTEGSFMRWLYSVCSKQFLRVKKDKNPNGWHKFYAPELEDLREAYAAFLGQPADKIFDDWAVE
jgi:Family of unknown function (DUF5906)